MSQFTLERCLKSQIICVLHLLFLTHPEHLSAQAYSLQTYRSSLPSSHSILQLSAPHSGRSPQLWKGFPPCKCDYIRNELNPKPLGTSVKDFLNKAFQRSCPESAPFLWKPTKKRNSGEASSDFSHLTPFLLASTSTLLLWPGFSPASLGFQYRLKPSSSLGILWDSSIKLGLLRHADLWLFCQRQPLCYSDHCL